MTSQLNVDTIVDKAGSGGTNVKIGNTSTYVGEGGSGTQNTVQSLAKLWATVDADASTVTAFDSFNVASIQDDATGKYGVTTTSAMGNANYYACGVCCYQSTSSDFDRYLGNNYTGGNIDADKTTTEAKFGSYEGSYVDTFVAGISFLGDLA